MKNKIVFIVMVIFIILIAYFTIFGLNIGKLKISSISNIIEKNDKINQNIEQLTQLTSVTFPDKTKTLESTLNEFNVQKQKYEEIADLDTNDDNVYEKEKYDISYLWTTLGKYANQNNISLSMNIKKASGVDLYDLEFTVQGEYVDISTFITKLENDSDLSYRIYNFKMTSGSASFTVKDINIDSSTLIKNSTISVNNNNNNNNDNSNNSDDNKTDEQSTNQNSESQSNE